MPKPIELNDKYDLVVWYSDDHQVKAYLADNVSGDPVSPIHIVAFAEDDHSLTLARVSDTEATVTVNGITFNLLIKDTSITVAS